MFKSESLFISVIFELMKAIIPVAGVGSRLRPHTYSQPKPLMPVAGKPILGFILERLIKAGVTEFVFVIGYLGEKLKIMSPIIFQISKPILFRNKLVKD